jgi:hypothetical protein
VFRAHDKKSCLRIGKDTTIAIYNRAHTMGNLLEHRGHDHPSKPQSQQQEPGNNTAQPHTLGKRQLFFFTGYLHLVSVPSNTAFGLLRTLSARQQTQIRSLAEGTQVMIRIIPHLRFPRTTGRDRDIIMEQGRTRRKTHKAEPQG